MHFPVNFFCYLHPVMRTNILLARLKGTRGGGGGELCQEPCLCFRDVQVKCTQLTPQHFFLSLNVVILLQDTTAKGRNAQLIQFGFYDNAPLSKVPSKRNRINFPGKDNGRCDGSSELCLV